MREASDLCSPSLSKTTQIGESRAARERERERERERDESMHYITSHNTVHTRSLFSSSLLFTNACPSIPSISIATDASTNSRIFAYPPSMDLQVYIQEARDLTAADSNGLSDPYVYLQLGSSKHKTPIVYNSLNPVWKEDFTFTVRDLTDDLILQVWDKDQLVDDFLGQLKIPLINVLNAEDQALPLQWYPLQKRRSKSKTAVSGEILLSVCLLKKSSLPDHSVRGRESKRHVVSTRDITSFEGCEVTSLTGSTPSLTQVNPTDLWMVGNSTEVDDKDGSSVETLHEINDREDSTANGTQMLEQLFDPSNIFYSEPVSDTLPENLPGGILLDERYAVGVKALNGILFSPGSMLYKELYSMQKTTNVQESPWKMSGRGLMCRVVSYTKAASRLVKEIEVTEDQSYVRADRNCYAVGVHVYTPDVPYGKCFHTELLFVMVPLSDIENGARLTISFRIIFTESTMMKMMIESKAKQGLEENFQQFAELLTNHADTLESSDDPSKDLDEEAVKLKSEWKLAFEYFANIRVLCSLVLLVLVLVHVCLANRRVIQGLEFWIMDMPDSFIEVITTCILVLLMQDLVKRTYHYFYVKFRQSGDHGVKAVGDGWMLSVSLIECVCLASANNFDPFVVFKCNGKQRTSSVKLQTSNPRWHEYFEFDAMQNPPSRMQVEVFHFEGPFTKPVLLGRAEISLLNRKSNDMDNMWIPLEGKRARSSEARIHLGVSLKVTKENVVTTRYLTKIEKDAGTKILRHSPEKNLTFQKLFSLGESEFLVDDFTCALKYTVPIQGRLFLSARILGFYSNIFGRKTKLSFIWEDIKDVKHDSPTNRMGNFFSSSLTICIEKGRADKAREYAKKLDANGRLHFQFQSFVNFGTACRMIMALWKEKLLTPEERMQKLLSMGSGIDGSAEPSRQEDDNGTFLGLEDASLTETYFTTFPFNVSSLLALYENQQLHAKIMEKTGFSNYSETTWITLSTKPSVEQQQQTFTLSSQSSKHINEITCLQQKSVPEDRKSCTIDEQLTFHNLPVGDDFQLQVRKEFRNLPANSESCWCRLYLGIAWRKNSVLQGKITQRMIEEFTKLNKDLLSFAKREVMKTNGRTHDATV